MIGVGIVGVGFMGRMHALALKRAPGARLAAVCSRDPAKRAGDWSSTRGNYGPPPGAFDLTGVATYAAFDALLSDDAVQLIDICAPTDSHAELAVRALAAGKHVLVEKPIALTLEDAGRMVDAADAAGRLLMVAHVLPFVAEFAVATELVRSGEYGNLRAGHFSRVISAPDWSAAVADAARTGGPALDLHVHDTHFVQLLAGCPDEVRASGIVGAGDEVEYLSTSYRYENGPALSSTCGAVAASSRPFAHGFELYFERATVEYSSAGVPLTVSPSEGAPFRPSLAAGDDLTALAAELSEAVRAVETGVPSLLLGAGLAADALRLCFAEVEAVTSGGVVKLGKSAARNPAR